jgi:hypothetical protein
VPAAVLAFSLPTVPPMSAREPIGVARPARVRDDA